MNLSTIEMDQAEAEAALAEWEVQLRAKHTEEDAAIAEGYALLAEARRAAGAEPMRVRLESASRVVNVNDSVQGRVWEGETQSGIRFFAVITRIAVDKDNDLGQFEAELLRCAEPSRGSYEAIPARLIL